MPYTAAQLTQYYMTVNRGATPDATTATAITAAANSDAVGSISDSQALQIAIATPQTRATSDVAELTYAFFTGSTPSSAGVDYLVTNPGSGYNTSYYNGASGTAAAPSAGGFNTENRYYNAAINLAAGPSSAGNGAFVSTYGALTLQQTITTAYNTIIGQGAATTTAGAAGVASIASSLSYFQTVAAQRAVGVSADIATKAIIVAYILEEAVKADIGVYAKALDQFNAAIAVGGAIYGSNLLTTYGAGGANFNPMFSAIADGQTFAGPATANGAINTTGVAANGTGTITTGANPTISVSNDLATNSGQLVVNEANATLAANTTDVLNLSYNGQTISAAPSVIAAGVESINVNASLGLTAAAGTTLSIDIQDQLLQTLIFSGNESVAYSAPQYAFLDGSVNTGALKTVSAGNSTAAANLDVSSAGAANATITLTGSSAADTLMFKSFATVSGGGGNDTFVVNAAASVAGLSSITDEHAGNIFAFAGAKVTSFNNVVSAAASVQAGVDAAANGAAGRASYFTFGGDTYVVLDNSPATTFQAGVDDVVRLVGIHTLTTSSINAQGALVSGG